MKKLLCLVLCLLMVLSVFAGCNAGGSGETTEAAPVTHTLSVGFGRSDITPAESIPLHGLGNPPGRMSTEVKDHLYATCIAFTDESDNTVLMFHLDLIGSVPTVSLLTRNEISKKTGIPMNQIMVTGTHNHSGPSLGYTDMPCISNYNESLKTWMMDAAMAALEDRKKVTGMYSTSALLENMNFIRHYNMGDGTVAGDNFGTFTGNTIVGHTLQPDNQLQLIKFVREGGKDVVLMNWQGHPTGHQNHRYAVLSDVDIIRKKLEPELDCQFAFFLGASGNVNNSSRIKGERVAKEYVEHNQRIAQFAIDATANYKEMEIGKVQIIGKNYPGVTKQNAKVTMDIPIFAISLGDVAFVTAPYEMFSESGKAIKDASPFKTTFVATCANASLSYMPTKSAFHYNGEMAYEVSCTKFAEGTAELLVEEFGTLLNTLSETAK